MVAYGAAGKVWDRDTLSAYLEAPREVVKGTKMTYPGQKNPDKRQAIIDFLATLTE